jgi:hypothetical protein
MAHPQRRHLFPQLLDFLLLLMHLLAQIVVRGVRVF